MGLCLTNISTIENAEGDIRFVNRSDLDGLVY